MLLLLHVDVQDLRRGRPLRLVLTVLSPGAAQRLLYSPCGDM